MVLIISDNNDPTTNLIIDWLDYYGISWHRINETDSITISSIRLVHGNEPEIVLAIDNDKLLNLREVQSYWYRRGILNLAYSFSPAFGYASLDQAAFYHCRSEREALRKFLFNYLETYKKSLGGFDEAENRKLTYLVIAQNAGLIIPQTLVCDHTQLLEEFVKASTGVVTKSIHETIGAVISKLQEVYARTFEVDLGETDKSINFFPSLFQHNIPKWIELRIFFLEMNLYTMAIFSQDNEQTKTDFRNYDNIRPNRNVPFRLPETVEEKVRLFIYNSGLNTGSIDMIVTPDLEYVFLEVNPVGQFEMVSYPCNYYLEQKIAQFLTA